MHIFDGVICFHAGFRLFMRTQMWQSMIDSWAAVGLIGAGVGVTVGAGVSAERSAVAGAAVVAGASMARDVGAG